MSVTPLDPTQQLSVTVVVRRPTYNGTTLHDHAQGIVAGTHLVLDHAEFRDMFGATDDDLDLVASFASAHGLTVENRYNSGANLILTGTVGAFNSAFGITLNQVVADDRTYHTYDGELVIPDELKDIVEHVLGLDTSVVFTHSARAYNPDTVGSPSSVPLTPQQVATAYNFPTNDGAGACVAIIELGGGYTNQNLTSSFSRIGITPNPTVVTAYGLNNPGNSDADIENMLDIYVIGGVVPKSTIAMYFGTPSMSGFYNAVAAAVNDNIRSPSIISISWGAPEFSKFMDSLFQSAIVKGITVTVATGDYGSEAVSGNPAYTVQYPASSPYVLACGGTTLQLNPNGTIASEVVWNQGNAGSGGGVSNLYTVPTWQAGLTSKLYPTPTVTALTGRGIPDVAGNADGATGYQFYYGLPNIFDQFGGTSAVAPLYAALFARITSLGYKVRFINSVLYSNPHVFQDITVGNNACPAAQGYSATTGWDACTGLGSPNGQAILNLLESARPKVKDNSGNWVYVQNIKVKTSSSTWSNVTATYTKTNSGWILIG
jgi:kumamolisin